MTTSHWKGFNLLGLFTSKSCQGFVEQDFRLVSELGFSFVRLPLTYRHWILDGDPFRLDEKKLEDIDQAIAWGHKHGLHVCLNLHRAPGFSVATDVQEPFNLWKDDEALRAFLFHWEHLARRYRHIPKDSISFNPVNEPKNISPEMSREDCLRVMIRFIESMRAISPERTLIIDGLSWGGEPMPELLHYDVIQSVRGYVPLPLTHFGAAWVDSKGWPEPQWPGTYPDGFWDAEKLAAWYKPWVELEAQGGTVHCGEFGCYNRTQHAVALAWMKDLLAFFESRNWGWALWNFRGSFGILDSDRKDVNDEDFHGHRLDRRMLDLLRAF